jgi:hypothetical protein
VLINADKVTDLYRMIPLHGNIFLKCQTLWYGMSFCQKDKFAIQRGLINILQPPTHCEGDTSLILIYITDIMIFTISFYPKLTSMSIDIGRGDSLYRIIINRKI